MIKLKSVARSAEIDIVPVRDRWYRLADCVEIEVKCLVDGVSRTIAYSFGEGFLFDGRSGGPLADLFVPNLGTQEEVACWLVHDANGYDVLLDFENTNELLQQMLRLSGHSKCKSWLVKLAVSISRSWFGEPIPGDREFPNVQLNLFDISWRST